MRYRKANKKKSGNEIGKRVEEWKNHGRMPNRGIGEDYLMHQKNTSGERAKTIEKAEMR